MIQIDTQPLKDARFERGLTTRLAAAGSKISPSTVYRLERTGKARESIVKTYADYLGVAIADLKPREVA